MVAKQACLKIQTMLKQFKTILKTQFCVKRLFQVLKVNLQILRTFFVIVVQFVYSNLSKILTFFVFFNDDDVLHTYLSLINSKF